MESKKIWANGGTNWTNQKRKRTRKRKNERTNNRLSKRIAERSTERSPAKTNGRKTEWTNARNQMNSWTTEYTALSIETR